MNCPLCQQPAAPTVGPYHECSSCHLWFQPVPPVKAWHGPHEGNYDAMADDEKRANEQLAAWLHEHWLKNKLGRTLDVGAGYPWLAHTLASMGHSSLAIDGEAHPFAAMKCLYLELDIERPNTVDALNDLGAVSLITFIHSFEHVSDPLSVLRRISAILEEDGLIFIRMPDHEVAGYERDLTAGHYLIHPFFHCLESILELCAQVGLALVWTSPLEPGQRDLVLRRTQPRRLGVAMIVRNEERDLPAALDSILPAASAIVVADTGSTDRTREVACERIAHYETRALVQRYVGASEKDASGEWKLWDFSKARNWSLQKLYERNVDWSFWLDGDDRVIDWRAVRRCLYRDDVDVMSASVLSSGRQWQQVRLWKTEHRIKFEGRCHEYPIINGLRSSGSPIQIVHTVEPAATQENSNPRNLRILLRSWEQDGPNERTAFYIANTYFDAGQPAAAVAWYDRRIAYGPEAFRDEYLFAQLYLARCFRDLEQWENAEGRLRAAMSEAPDWCEFRMEMAWAAKQQNLLLAAIDQALPCVDAPIPPTPLWRELDSYRQRPCRLIAQCYEQIGLLDKALAWTLKAESYDGSSGESERLATLIREQQIAPAIIPDLKRKQIIGLVRPGAIGDVLMTLNLLPAFIAAHPEAEVRYFTRISGLGALIAATGAVPTPMITATQSVCDRVIQLVGYPLAEGYPNVPMRQHLLRYFSDELGLPWNGMPALEVPLPRRPAHVPETNYISVQTAAGWSKYKQWPARQWLALLRNLPLPWQLVDESEKRTLQESIAVVANARLHVGVDSFCNHLTNYIWRAPGYARKVRGVILWGSTQADAAGYSHNVNLSAGLACQPCFKENPALSAMANGACVNPPRETYEDETPWACMEAITPEMVISAVNTQLGSML